MRGWLFQIFMPAVGLGQNTPPVALRSLAASSTTASLRTVLSIAAFSDLGEPVGVLGIAAVHDVEEGRLDLLGDGAARADADLHAVQIADGRDFRGRAGEERLVADGDLVARDALLHDVDPQGFGDMEHRVARD